MDIDQSVFSIARRLPRYLQPVASNDLDNFSAGITPTMLRNRFVLNALQNDMKPIEIKSFLGLKSVEALHRYVQFWNKQQ